MTAPRQPGERPAYRALLPAPLLTAALAAVAVAGGVARAPDEARVPLVLGGAVAALLLCAAVTVAVHGIRSARLSGRRLAVATDDAGRLLHDRARLAEELNHVRAGTAADLERERARVSADLARERARLTEASAQEFSRLQREKAYEITRLTEDSLRLTEELRRANQERAAALAATANAAGRMQALATSTLADLRAMEDRHTDEDVLADLLHLDHRTAQAGRLADSIAVLSGARSGRRWARPIVMESILRGAMGRISGYQRVRVHSASDAAVAGHAAEGVMHALAELLDNAANFSPPTAEVHVYVEEVPGGVIVSVEDSGLVMSDVQLHRAERAVSGEDGRSDAKGSGRNSEGAGLGGLTGTRLGLTVVGRLARKYGLTVSFRPSARGGTGVLVLIPQDILAGSTVAAEPLPMPMPPPPTPTPSAQPVPEAPAAPAPTPGEPWEARSGEREQERHPQASYPEEGHVEWPYPEELYTNAPSAREPYAQEQPNAREPYGEQPHAEQPYAEQSYAAARAAVGDLDPDPVPTHESPDPAPQPPESHRAEVPPGELPQRRRGRTLAEAERSRGGAQADESGFSIPLAPPDPDDTRERVARFGSFRQAVRGTVPDQAVLQGSAAGPEPTPAPSAAPAQAPLIPTEAAPAPPTTTPPTTSHPEGDPTP
ncbi:ATP-binding protein [Streptomyces lacrimifluminis]|uniref:histidine kinase n=1 Tax=Streptomyces lacrimifluminis TaxID=1500077 RepID=A0A917KCG3_9ACTN|nr:ATP-binding protein [Streptomyces lacrimifluminis]GGJ09156.1 histidine kinase [Streptomyces lacrimifluminis]